MPGHELIGVEERQEVLRVMETGALFRFGFETKRNNIWMVKEFEKTIADVSSRRYCHAVSSGTAALITALAACDIKPGDEIIVPTFTFVATIEAVIQFGAVPIFCSIDKSLGLDPTAVERLVTENTKAVITVHMCGMPARIQEISLICKKKNLLLIEDACQAMGTIIDGEPAGSYGEISCISFDYVKLITCGEGGAVLTDDLELNVRVQEYSDHGHDYKGANRGLDGHRKPGVNFRLSELSAAVGVGQMKRYRPLLEVQQSNSKKIAEALSWAEVINPAKGSSTNGMFVNVLLPSAESAEQFCKFLGSRGVASAYWFANNWHYFRRWEHFGDSISRIEKFVTNQSDNIVSRLISLPISASWSEQDLQMVSETILIAEQSMAEYGRADL